MCVCMRVCMCVVIGKLYSPTHISVENFEGWWSPSGRSSVARALVAKLETLLAFHFPPFYLKLLTLH